MTKPAVTSDAWSALFLVLCFDVALLAIVLVIVSSMRACDAQEPVGAAARRMLGAFAER